MPTPKEMNHSTLLKMARVEVDAAIWELPSDVRAILERVPVFLERRPDADDIAAGVEADTLGIFEEGAAEPLRPLAFASGWKTFGRSLKVTSPAFERKCEPLCFTKSATFLAGTSRTLKIGGWTDSPCR